MRYDARGRAEALHAADGTRLTFDHDGDGNLRRIAAGDWFVRIESGTRRPTFAVEDPAGRTELTLSREGRSREISRGDQRLVLHMDDQERLRRAVLPGSAEALVYDWDEDGGCTVRAASGGSVLALSAAGRGRRVSVAPDTYWDEELTPLRVRLATVAAGIAQPSLTLTLQGMVAISERAWSDGARDVFARDEIGRLTAWTRTRAGETVRRPWSYEGDHLAAFGEAVRRTDPAGRVLSLHRPDADDIAYRYDSAGRRIARTQAGRVTLYRYDPLGTLQAVVDADGAETVFETDGLGRRTAVRRNGETRFEHRDELGRLWSVTDGAGVVLHTYVWLGDRIAARLDGPVGSPVAEAYVCDPLGTPVAALIADGEGWRFERLEAPPYGEASSDARPTLFGHLADTPSGLVHFGARDYDPELGVFLTPDPWHGGDDDPRRWGGADAAMLRREREMPVEGFCDYALCRYDPLGRYDRDGHASAGDVAVHILRWILLPTWGFPLTSISLFFFEPLNLYMELVGLIIWAFKQLCDDKSHPWGNNTIASSTGLLGSLRQFTFAFGLNGFLPRVVSGKGLNADRAVTVGNVIWINRHELAMMGRPEVVEVSDIAGGPGGAKFNGDPAQESAVALLCADGDGKQKLHVSLWTRGFGNAVSADPADAHKQFFVDKPTTAGAAAPGTLLLRYPIPEDTPYPSGAKDKESIEVQEYLAPVAPPPAGFANLETVAETWFALKLPKDTSFVKGDWVRVLASGAPNPKPDAAFVQIGDKLPADDFSTLILTRDLPLRFSTAHFSTDLRLDGVTTDAGAASSAGWTAAAAGATQTLSRTLPAGPPPADFPAPLTKGGIVKMVSAAAVAPPAPVGLPAAAALGPQDTAYAVIKEMRVTLTLARPAGAVVAGALVQLQAPDGAAFSGVVEKITALDTVKLLAPFPKIKKDDLLIVTRSGAPAATYVRVSASKAGGVLTLDPPLGADLAAADGAAVKLQRTKDTNTDTDKAEAASVAGADLVVKPQFGALFSKGNLLRVDVGGTPALHLISALPTMEIDVADPPAGTGLVTLTSASLRPDRVRKDVELAPPGRFLKRTGGGQPHAFGSWPQNLLAIRPDGNLLSLADSANAVFYARWSAGRPAGFHADFHRTWQLATIGADEYVVLETPLPLKRKALKTGGSEIAWDVDPDDRDDANEITLNIAAATLKLTAVEFTASPAKRVDTAGTRVLAQEPELLVPESPKLHDTHRRALIEHEIHHTVQGNFWGPIMTALPLQGLTILIGDLVGGTGNTIPDWVKHLAGAAPGASEGDVGKVAVDIIHALSLGGLMEVAWKYVILDPLRPFGDLGGKIDALNFDDFNKVFNPLSRWITQQAPQVDPTAPAGTRWLEFLGKLLTRGLDMQSWTPFTGFVPLLLPDGELNFIEQQASRASGDLYSTILTVNDRFNLHSKGRLFGSHDTTDANMHPGVGRAVRLLVFCGYRTDRVLQPAFANRPTSPVTYLKFHRPHPPVRITLPAPGAGPAPGPMLFHDLLFEVQRPSAAPGAPPTPPPATREVEGPAPGRAKLTFVEAVAGDVVVPRLRALVPMPPRVNRSLGFFLIPGAPGALQIDAHAGVEEDAHIVVGGTMTAGDTVTPTAVSPQLTGSPFVLGPYTITATDKAEDVAKAIAALISGNGVLNQEDVFAVAEGATVKIYAPSRLSPSVVWTAPQTGASETYAVDMGGALKGNSRTQTVLLTVEDEVGLDDELVAWELPAPAPVAPAAPVMPTTSVTRFQTERPTLKAKNRKSLGTGAFEAIGIDGLILDIADASVTSDKLKDGTGWELALPLAALAAPTRVRLFRTVKKDDSAFDLLFDDVPPLVNVHSYLDDDVFVVVRDFMMTVSALPDLLPQTTAWDVAVELKLPIKLVGGASAITILPPAGLTSPPVTRVGDGPDRGETWKIGPMPDPPGDDAVFQVKVVYGRPGATVEKPFALTVTPSIKITAANFDLRPGTALDLTLAGGTAPYTVSFDPALPGLGSTLPAPTTVRVLAQAAPDKDDTEVKVQILDSGSPKLRGTQRLKVKMMPPLLLGHDDPEYFKYVRPATMGLATPLLNGRSSGGAGPDVDLTEPLDAMEAAVKATGAGDAVYLSSWFFEPATVLTAGGLPGATTWGELFALKAKQGVIVRLVINDFDPVAEDIFKWLENTGLAPFNAIIAALPAASRDNLKYLVCMHPAHAGPFKSLVAAGKFRNVYVASHHQKFMIVRRGAEMTAFCGGLDIESRKTPAQWGYGAHSLVGWHDIHVKLEGPITRDLEREFVFRWNRDRNSNGRPALAGWKAMEELVSTPLSPADDVPAKKTHLLQMVRTISDNATLSPFETKRADIKETYRRAIAGAKTFLYLENQYFRSTDLADWIVAQGKANPALVVVMVVLANAAADDGDNILTQHGNFLQFETFDRISKALGARFGLFTMTQRSVHAKFLLVDDVWMTIGSANANVRSFELDSELNVQIADAPLTGAFRTRLWAHNLGVPEAVVAGWAPADYLAQWRAVAAANTAAVGPSVMAGEGVVLFDYTTASGKSHSSLIPDALASLDLSVDSDGIVV